MEFTNDAVTLVTLTSEQVDGPSFFLGDFHFQVVAISGKIRQPQEVLASTERKLQFSSVQPKMGNWHSMASTADLIFGNPASVLSRRKTNFIKQTVLPAWQWRTFVFITTWISYFGRVAAGARILLRSEAAAKGACKRWRAAKTYRVSCNKFPSQRITEPAILKWIRIPHFLKRSWIYDRDLYLEIANLLNPLFMLNWRCKHDRSLSHLSGTWWHLGRTVIAFKIPKRDGKRPPQSESELFGLPK